MPNPNSYNILVTGSNGQVGSELKELSSKYPYKFYFSDKKELDITNIHDVRKYIIENNIDTIINCAAYTAVDKAESEPELANKINHLAVGHLAQIAKDNNIKLVHISTDYLFDGQNHKPYIESDTSNPQNVYGQTKMDGENAMLAINPANSIIVRTSWVYSSYGANFVKTMLRLGKEKESLGVIYDQIGTPTYAADLAKAILDILPCISNNTVEIYHYTNEGVVSWYDFAKEIMKMAKLDCKINPIESSEYLALNADTPVPKGKVGRPTPATRPHYSLLSKSKIKKEFSLDIPYWKESLKECLIKLGEKNEN